ncbi:MAG: FAD-binding protein, partial [Bacillota bacterium]
MDGFTMNILAAILAPDGQLHAGWAELIGCAVEAARAAGGRAEALVLGGFQPGAASAQVAQAWRAGAERVFVAGDATLADPDPDRYLGALAEAARATEASTIVLNGDPFGAQIGPRLAMRLGAAPITDAVGVRPADGKPAWIRPMYGGKAMAVIGTRRPKAVVTVRPRAFAAPAPRAGEPPAEAIVQVALKEVGSAPGRVRVVERKRAASEGLRLEDARVIVSGGRGIGGAEGFQMLQKLAGVLGGAVGASRAAVDAGWIAGHLQIGQTGKMV